MIVSELIEALKKFPQDLEVQLCDGGHYTLVETATLEDDADTVTKFVIIWSATP